MLLQKLIDPSQKRTRYIIVIFVFLMYVGIFAYFHNNLGLEVSSLAIFPIIIGSWYFGIGGGIFTTIMLVITDISSLFIIQQSLQKLWDDPGYIVSVFIFLIISVIVGRMATILRERSETLLKLKVLEEERQKYTELLESLHRITKVVLEHQDLKSALAVLVESIGKLFKADDCFFAFWDEDRKLTTPVIAYGSMSETYPKLVFEAGERTLSAKIMETGHPIVIEDLKASTFFNSRIKSIFPSRVILGIPLIVQGNKIATFSLGYNHRRKIEPQEINHAEIAAQQIALVLTKLRLLENTQLQVKQLKVLHEVATITTEVETIDQLIERTTEVIGKSLFSDNFGILLMDEEKGVLHPHPSYRFVSTTLSIPSEVPLGKGVSGQVALTGVAMRLGNIKEIDNYLNIDPGTVSELCVPIKIKDRVLGIINSESGEPGAYTQDDKILLGTLAGQLATAIEQLKSKEAEKKWLEQLAHSNELTYALAQITTEIEKKHYVDDVVQTLGDELNKVNITSVISIFDREKKVFGINYTSISPKTLKNLGEAINFPLEEYTFSMEDLYSRIGSKDLTQPMTISNPDNEFQILIPYKLSGRINVSLQETGVTLPSEIFRLPLIVEENLFGIVWLWGESVTQSDLPIMSIFANQIGINIQNAYLFQEIRNLALTDPLTSLHNRRSLFELGRIEFSRAIRMNRSFCCMMLDLDHFKLVNDVHGHQVGDLVLQEFASRSVKSVREVDLVGRYGGEELIIFLPETDIGTAKIVAERLRKSIADKPFEVSSQELKITVSIGVAGKDNNTVHLETLIARADQAMYIAKHKGRNAVAVSV